MKKTNNAAQLSIQYQSPDGHVLSVPLGERELTIGSAENADIQLSSTTISRLHVRITVRDNDVYVTDLDSRNGSFLNGLRLQPNVEHEWLPGNSLRLSDTTLELLKQVIQEKKPLSELKITADPLLIKAGQTVRLTLTTTGETQQVTLQSQSIVPGLVTQLNWQGGEVKPETPVEIQAQIHSTKMSLTGGERRMRFVALSRSNLISTVEVKVQLRKRVETLLLLLLFLTGCSAASLAAIVVVRQIIQPAPSESPDKKEVANKPPQSAQAPEPVTPAMAALSPITPTKTPTPTIPPTITPSVTPSNTPPSPTAVIVTPCPNGTVITYTVQQGDTLSNIGLRYDTNVDALMNNNNKITNPAQIYAGEKLKIRCGEYAQKIPSPPVVCQSVTPTSPLGGLDCALNTFYWDPVPNADYYQLNIYDDKFNLLKSLMTLGNQTNLDADLSSFPGLQFSWGVEAFQNGQVICSSQLVTMLRSPCPQPPQIVQQADLVVSNIQLAANPTWSQQCSLLTVNISYTLTNIGDAPSGSFLSNATYQTISGVVDSQCNRGCGQADLQPGQSVTISDQSQLTFNNLRGSQQITVVATADVGVNGQVCTNPTYCQVNEKQEGNNNSATLNITIPNCIPETDLSVRITGITSAACSNTVPNFFDVTYTYTITNIGPTNANSVTIDVASTLRLERINGNNTSQNFPVNRNVAIPVNPNNPQTFTETISMQAPPAQFRYELSLDVTVSTANPIDIDSTNNTATEIGQLSNATFNCAPPVIN